MARALKKQGDKFAKFLKLVEWLGNCLPHPVSLFAIFALGIVVLSGILSYLGLEVVDPRDNIRIIGVISLFNAEGLRRIMTGLVTNFTLFVPLGTVLVTMLGVGVAEASGLLSTAIRSIVLYTPKKLITMAVVFAGVLSNTASEMGYVVLIPMAGFLFLGMRRHPLAGMAAAFAGVSGGYSANLLIGTVDPLLAGITQEAARFIDPAYEVHPAVNWYFMAVSTFLVTIVGTWVTSRYVEPTLGKYDDKNSEKGGVSGEEYLKPLTKAEKKAFKLAGLACLGVLAVFALTIVPENGILRNQETGDVFHSPFMKGLVAFLFIFFLVPSAVYGFVVKKFKTDQEIIDGMAASMSKLGLYIVLVFFAAQFVAFFKWTQLGEIMAVLGADFLRAINLDNPIVSLPFVLMCAFVNLMLGSASAQWAVTAPIFVPMLMTLGYSPEVIQAAYRIGDSTTNIITPMMSYFGLILAFACRFDRKIGIGTIISMMLPYTIFFLISWLILFYVWVFVLQLPVGPGAPTYYVPN